MVMSRKIAAKLLNDPEFRDMFPGLEDGIAEFVRNPSCPCSAGTIKAVAERLAGTNENSTISNDWRVIDCDVSELSAELARKHPNGKRQFAIAREGNRVLCVLNEMTEAKNG